MVFASVVKTSRGYMTYIGGCVSKSRIVKLKNTTIDPHNLADMSTCVSHHAVDLFF